MYHDFLYKNGGHIMVKKILIGLATASLLFSTHALACKKMNKTTMQPSQKSHKRLVDDVISAISKTGLSAVQTKKVADGIAEYRSTMAEIRQMRIFPIDSFINDQFDEKNFILEMSEKSQARIAAKAALFKYVFAILDDDQRKIFKRAYAAPLIEQMIRMNMNKNTPMMTQGKRKQMMSLKGCQSCNK